MTPADFARTAGVSRETLDRLTAYADLLTKWQARINLVGPATLPDVWRRHMLDSAQLFPLLPPGVGTLADLGSGAGFPGLVLAIMGVPHVHLIESDGRKGAFLREAARITGTAVTLHTARIESVQGLAADVVTARALAPLGQLLAYAHPLLKADGQCLFLKGKTGEDELTAASKDWNMTIERVASLSDPAALILRIKEVSRGRTTH